MTDPRSYPEDQGPFDAAAEAPAGEKVFTADDPAAPDAVQYDADLADPEPDAASDSDTESESESDSEPRLEPLELGSETDVDPDLGLTND
ncbi:MAG: hypothetical protein P0Y60_16625 [Candidatus Microbacterium colombiense]|nr:MAG: hypothetical protein P0Y60_16625 [Microbacterium sp.]